MVPVDLRRTARETHTTTQTHDTMINKRYTHAVAVFVALLVIASTVFTGAAVATGDDGYFGGFVEDPDASDDSFLPFDTPTGAQVWAVVDGFQTRALHAVSGGSGASAADAADDVQAEYNIHTAEYEQYLNDRVTADSNHDVVAVTFTLDDKSDTVYWVADVNSTDDSFENTSVVDSTDRTVDQTMELHGLGAENAAKELSGFHDDYVTENKTPQRGSGYLTGLGAKYAGDIDTTLIEIQGGFL